MQIIGFTLLAALVVFNLYATRLIVRHEDDRQRRVLQLLFVWLVPLFGASAATMAHRPSIGAHSDPELDYGRATRESDFTGGH